MANNSKSKKSTQKAKKSSTTKSVDKEMKNKDYVNKAEDKSKNGIVAVILFGISLLVLVLCCIPGGTDDSVWEKIRTFTFGLFGLSAFLWPLWMIYIALMTGRNKINEKGVKWQIVGSAIFIVALSSLVHIIGNTKGYLVYTPITEQLKTVFSIGLKFKNGGLFGTLIGGLLALLCANKVAPICIILVIGLTVGLLVTKTSLDRLKDALSKPVKSANEKIKQKKVEKSSSYNEYDDNSYTDFTPYDTYDAEPYVPIEEDEDYYIPENNIKVRSDLLSDKESENKEPVKDIDLIIPEIITQGYADRKKAAESKPKISDNLIHSFDIDMDNSFSNKSDDLPSVTEEDYFSDKKPAEESKSTVVKPVRKPRKPKEEAIQEINNTDVLSKDAFVSSETSYITSKSGKSLIYKFPPNTCLNKVSADNKNYNSELQANGAKLVETLRSFGVETKIIDICRGPSVTRYEIQPAPGVKISRITGLADDIAMNMASSGIRIAPIPVKAAIGIEIPNRNRSMVSFREIIDSNVYKDSKSKLNVALGKDISGDIICADISKMPHLLIAGTTGSGKSVCVNSMIVSLLYNATPDEVKFLMIDPKQVEFTVYDGIPHLLVPVVSDPKKAAGALAWAVTEMENRYKLLSERNVRNIGAYNKFCESHPEVPKMYSIVIFIDEFSDLMMIAANEVEDSVCRLAQKARAAGIHLVIATQRPSVDVITGLIKANVPSRISLSVSSQIDSRTIIDTAGAEKLLGNGDMLFNPIGSSKPIRVQGAFLSDEEVENVVSFIKNQSKCDNVYDEDVQEKIDNFALIEKKKTGIDSTNDDEEKIDPMLSRAIEVVVDNKMASTTLLQKKLKLGYARASRMIDSLEERGIVGPFQGSKPREVLMTKQQYLEMKALSEDGNLDMRNSNNYEDDNNDYDEEDDF